MIFEVHTFGGGEYLSDIFNGIAALTSGSSYLNIIKISALFALTWALLQSAFTNNFRQSVTWFVSFMLMYNVLFVPKATLLVHDPLNRKQLYREIPNVPFALAAFASYSSSAGKELTELMETAFTPVDYLPYHEHGMLFGSKLISLSTSMKIVDEEFASSVNSFIKQCVFYDLLLHRYTLDELRNSDDIWNFLTVENQASQARSFLLSENGEQNIKTCREGAVQLKGRWDVQINKGAGVFGKLIFPNETPQAAKTLLLSHLPASYSPLLSVSKSAVDLIKQNMLINAFDRAGSDFSNTGSNGTNIYMAIRSNLQTKAAFSASKRQAEEWVPILRIVFEVLFYGAFPLMFLLFLLPIGAQIAKGYFITFIWLQSWAPLYAILNRVMIGQASLKSAALGGYGLTIATQGGIEEINQSVALMAGYLSWSIPFIAAGLAKGTMAVTGLSTSMLAIPQSAASSAAAEASTGNFSLGNVNLDNSSFNNTTGNKMNDSAFFDTARMQAVNFSGGVTSTNADGRSVYDQTGSTSRLPNMQLTSNDTQAQSAMLNATVSQNMGENFSKQASFAKSKSIDQLASAMASHSINENHGVRFAENTSSEVREAYGRLEQEANELIHNNGIDQTSAFNMALNGSMGIGGGGLGLGGSASINASSDSRSNDGYSESERIYRYNQLTKDVATVSNAIKDRSLELSDSHGNSLNETFSHNYSEAQRFEEQSRAYFDTAKSYSEQAQYLSSQSLSFNQDRIPEFIEYAKSQRDINGNPLEERALTILANDPIASQNLKDKFVHDNGMNNFKKSFTGEEKRLEVDNLESRYGNITPNVEGEGRLAVEDDVNAYFDKATKGKTIDNSILQNSTDEKIAANTHSIQSQHIDKANIEQSVQEKLKDGAFVTQAKSFSLHRIPETLGNKQADKVSNFNNGDNNDE